MDDTIQKILEIIGDYREEDSIMSHSRIKKWVTQFKEDDQVFLLNELLHILPESYLSKKNTLRILGNIFETLKNDFGYSTVLELLDETCFLHCQPSPKSQAVLLEYLDQILIDKYGRSVNDCGSKDIKNWIYLDDVLASGGTFKKDILNEINKYGKEEFRKSEIRIINLFFILHSWGKNNSDYAIDLKLGYSIRNKRSYYQVKEIDNNPRINQYNSSPKFNFVYPTECKEGLDFLDFIQNAFTRDYEMKNREFAFRHSNYPKEETFFSSTDNRKRYEKIILDKGIEIIGSIEKIKAHSLRPLGMTPPSFKTLGTGSHVFTWRNISNTCPLVFWWEANNWYPLFPVQNRGIH